MFAVVGYYLFHQRNKETIPYADDGMKKVHIDFADEIEEGQM